MPDEVPGEARLSATAATATLTDYFTLEVSRRQEGALLPPCADQPLPPPPPPPPPAFAQPPPHAPADIAHTQAQLHAAVQELDLVREEAQRMLDQCTAGLQREHAAAMAALERGFLSDAEALQVGGCCSLPPGDRRPGEPG